MINALIVFIGGGTGAVARYFVALLVKQAAGGRSFPYHTLCINLLGAFLIGAVMESLALRASLPRQTQLLLVTGFLGGFTTFSAFSLEASLMLERQDYFACAIYVVASVVGTISLVFLGAGAARTFL